MKDSILQLMKTVCKYRRKIAKATRTPEFVQILSDTTSTDDDENPVGEVVLFVFNRTLHETQKGRRERPMLTNDYRLTDRLDTDPLD